jgi:DNA-binding winged helix-turn-helix (wHTH) protein
VTATFTNLQTSYVVVRKAIGDTISKAGESDALPIGDLSFGEFELAPDARALWRRGGQVRVGSRALDILIALASRPGQFVSKDDLTKLVWGRAFVDETGLRGGISALRKALGPGGDRYIATVPDRGYCFVLDVETTAAKSAPKHPHVKRPNPQRLPAQIARVVGRDDVIATLAAEVSRRRLTLKEIVKELQVGDANITAFNTLITNLS